MSPKSLRVLRLSEAAKNMLRERWPAKKLDLELDSSVKRIIDEVKERGVRVLIELAQKSDGVRLSPYQLKVNSAEIKEAYSKAKVEQINAVKFVKKRVEKLEKNFLARLEYDYISGVMKVKRRCHTITSVGCYVPRGRTAYPNSLIMTVVPAKVADVLRIVVCSPPGKYGEINLLNLVAADIRGDDEIYRVGGAQAIAALDYGTETIAPVYKIAGPGNKYVLAAKIAVAQYVPIDLPAGPSEIVIRANESAEPKTIALDLISQAEHGADGISILVTSSAELANKVAEEIGIQLENLPNSNVALELLAKNGAILLYDKVDDAISFINDFTPEHLEIRIQKAQEIAKKIYAAGLILIGEYTSVSASDYCLGTSHVLPTGGRGKVFSGLSVLDYVKTINIVECSKTCLSSLRRQIEILTAREGLPNHAQAFEGRFRK